MPSNVSLLTSTPAQILVLTDGGPCPPRATEPQGHVYTQDKAFLESLECFECAWWLSPLKLDRPGISD